MDLHSYTNLVDLSLGVECLSSDIGGSASYFSKMPLVKVVWTPSMTGTYFPDIISSCFHSCCSDS